MTDRATLLALAARAEAGGDAMLSDDVWLALGWKRGEYQGWITPDGQCHEMFPRPNVAESLDAQRRLPGRITLSREMAPNKWRAVAWQDGHLTGNAPSEPLARLAARLRAMAAAQEAHDGQ